jgi:hypothetical protein
MQRLQRFAEKKCKKRIGIKYFCLTCIPASIFLPYFVFFPSFPANCSFSAQLCVSLRLCDKFFQPASLG